jgi:hypothetical protein
MVFIYNKDDNNNDKCIVKNTNQDNINNNDDESDEDDVSISKCANVEMMCMMMVQDLLTELSDGSIQLLFFFSLQIL